MNECKIVEDLLPLYAEELVSEETKTFVEHHCAGCEKCEKIRSRAMEPVPKVTVDPKAYQKQLRRDTMKMIAKGVRNTLLIFLTFVILLVGGTVYLSWKGGEFPLENSYVSEIVHEEYGTFVIQIKIADWDNSGYRGSGAGSVITTRKTKGRVGEAAGTIYRSGEHWENVRVYWAPNGMDYLLEADIAGGSRDYFLTDHEFEEIRPGVGRLQEICHDRPLKERILYLCKKEEGFPEGWGTVELSFYQWSDDCETVSFIYETDDGFRGLVDFHYSTGTVDVFPAGK